MPLTQQQLDDQQADQDAINASVRSTDQSMDANAPSMWHGFGRGVPSSVMQGLASAGKGVATLAGAPIAKRIDVANSEPGKPQSTTAQDWLFDKIDRYATNAVDYWRPDPSTIGSAGQLFNNFVSGVTPFALGPEAGAGAIGANEASGLVDQGVDAAPAAAVGVVQSAAALGGFKIPFLGSTMSARVASGMVGNVALGGGAAEISHGILKESGDEKQAEEFNPLDLTARGIDLLTGGVMGLHANATLHSAATPEALDAVMTARNAQNFQHTVHPGDPADGASARRANDAITSAVAAIVNGEKVDVGAVIAGADFTDHAAPPPAPAHVGDALATIPGTPEHAVMGDYVHFRRTLESADKLHPGGNPDAANPHSTAVGIDQFTAPTWLTTVAQARPGWAEGMSREQLLAARTDPAKSTEMAEHLDHENGAALRAAGVLVDNYSLYAAHHFGPAHAVEFARADGTTPIDHVLTPAQMEANPYLRHKGTGVALTKAEVEANWRHRARDAGVFDQHDLTAENFGLEAPPQTLAADDPRLTAIPEGDNGRETWNIKSAERTALRTRLVDEHFTDVVSRELAAGERPILYLMGGGGASGKGTILRALRNRGVIPESGVVEVDPDAIKTGDARRKLSGLPEYQQFHAAGDSRAAAVVHEESSKIAGMAVDRAIAGKYDLVYDRTMGDRAKGLADIAKFKKAGYDVRLFGVTVDPKIAVVRAVKRAQGSGRFVPLDRLLAAHKGFAGTFHEYAAQADRAHLFDNSGGPGQQRLLASKEAGAELTIQDPSRYNSFHERSGINEGATTLGGLDQAPDAGRARPGDAESAVHARRMGEGDGGTGRAGSSERAVRNSAGQKAPPLDPTAFPIQGAESKVVTERGQVIPVKWAVVEASSLVTSHDDALHVNPDYPAELQPRDRSRAASEQQITKIANAINPDLLGASPKAADGAPIIGTDKVVESGNARTIALRRAYARGKADGYASWLKEHAKAFSVDPEAIAGLREPVLVRVAEGHDRADFARQANEAGVAELSPAEQAQSDAKRMPDLATMVPNEDGSINLDRSGAFIGKFMESVPPNERGRMLTGSGDLSTVGVARIRNAIFAKAYGDPDLVALLTESTDANVKNVLAGMMKSAAQIAKQRDAIAAGDLHPVDIAPDLVAAVRKFSQLKAQRESVEQYLGQGDLLGGNRDPHLANWLVALDENSRAPKRIADLISRQVDAVDAMGRPGQGDLMGGDKPAGDTADILRTAVADVRARNTIKATRALFGANGKPSSEALAPELQALDHLATEAPNTQLVDGYDSDMTPRYTSVGDLQASIAAEHAAAVQDAEAYEAGVNCFIRRGQSHAA